MLAETAAQTTSWSKVRDLLSLAKPRLSLLVIITMVGGVGFAPVAMEPFRMLIAVLTTAIIVGGANALNCVIERERDAQMRRTMQRPLAAGRVGPREALIFWATVVAIATPSLCWASNLLTTVLALSSLVVYAFIYTPLKYRTPLALYVGAIPGAIPPLMGWTAATGSIDAGAIALFSVMFCWQLPHFLAITLYLKDDYSRAGMKIYSIVHGERRTRWAILLTSILLVPVTLSLIPLGLAGWGYGSVALVLGLGLVLYSASGLRESNRGNRWARSMFLATIGYIPPLFAAMVLGAV